VKEWPCPRPVVGVRFSGLKPGLLSDAPHGQMNASELLNVLADRRRNQREFSAWAKSAGLRKSPLGAVEDCGSWLHLREWLEHEGKTTLRNANFCKKHLLCPGCAHRRAMKLIDAYLPKVESVMEGLHPVMVTLTVRNNPDLKVGMAQIRAAWSKMVASRRKGLSDACRHEPIEWCKVKGALRAFEVTRKPGEWHPHLHCFALVDDWIDREKLSEEWLKFTGDSFIVDVRRCRGGAKAGLLEVLKYALKFGGLSHPDRWHAFECMAGSRLTDAFGSLRGVPEPEINEDDESPYSGRYRDLVALWSVGTAFYKLWPSGEGVIEPETPEIESQP